MSYPDLGCYAECLTCELCGEGFDGGQNPDLMPGDLPDADPFGLGDWAPPEQPEGPDKWWSNWNLPTGGPSVGGVEFRPTYSDGTVGFQVSGRW